MKKNVICNQFLSASASEHDTDELRSQRRKNPGKEESIIPRGQQTILQGGQEDKKCM